jgi:hypothetical protein
MKEHDSASETAGEEKQYPMNPLEFFQSSPLAEAIASGELDPAVFERPREFGRDFTFEDEDPDGE